MSPRTLPALVLWMALALLVPATARAERELPSPLAALPAELRAGETVDLCWNGLPEGVEELEILLSLDDGRSWTLRVSPELEAEEGHYRWRVPNLPAAEARLRVRCGSEEDGEREAEPTAAFRIVGRADLPIETPRFHEAHAWPGVEAAAGAVPASDLRAGATLRDGVPAACDADTPRPGYAPERTAVARAFTRLQCAPDLPEPAPRSRRPTFVPARN